MHSIEHLPNVKVSDTLEDIIINICKKKYFYKLFILY